MGGPCFIIICASGETLLVDGLSKLVKKLAINGHYIEIVTNGILTTRIKDYLVLPIELQKRITFKLSFHYEELINKSLLKKYFDNVDLIKNSECSFNVEMTPVDSLEKHICDILKVCNDRLTVPCHCTIARNDILTDKPVLSKHSLEDYCDVWKEFDSSMIKFKKTIFGIKRKEFCYAGDWSLYIDAITGNYRKCYSTNVIGNIFSDRKIKLNAIGKCPLPHCYNGHTLLTFGLIPNIITPFYSDIRNRLLANGEEWIKNDMKKFMSTKLNDSNKEYSLIRKTYIYFSIYRKKVLSGFRKRVKRLYRIFHW